MILGLKSHVHAQCFSEIDEAVRQIRGDDRVVFNAHEFSPFRGDIVYNLENVPPAHMPGMRSYPGHILWDFSARNTQRCMDRGREVTHVPIGHHPSMKRFERAADPDIDVVFSGSLNARRIDVLQALQREGLNVQVVPPDVYGEERDKILARAKLALNMLYYPEGVFPALRVAHLVANGVPVLSETCPEGWPFVSTCSYDSLVVNALHLLENADYREMAARFALARFKQMPLTLPEIF